MTQPAAATGPGPTFLARGPAAIDQNGTSSGPGATPRPVRSADQPQTSWHHKVTSSSIAPKAVPKTTFAAVAVAKTGRRSRCSSMTGDGCLADLRMNSATPAAAAAIRPSVAGEDQPQASDLTRARASAPMATVNTVAPSVSGSASARSAASPARAAARGSGWSIRWPATTASTTTGTLTRNTQCQLTATRAPPSTGPSAAAAPPTEVHALMVPVRFSGRAAASSRPREAGMSSAPPAAWTTRAATSTQTSGAAAQAAEARPNTTIPVRNAARRPIRSAARPAGTSSAANTIAYAFSTHDRSGRLAPE